MTRIFKENINTIEHWNKVYETELAKNKIRIEPERFEKVSNMIPDGARVLDVGCGTGEFVKFLHSKKNKCGISGIDFSVKAIEYAKKTCPECAFFVKDVMQSSEMFTDVEYIVCFETIEHLDEPLLFVEEMYKTLKKGGILFLSTPYNNQVSGGKEHIHSFLFKDMIEYFEVFKKWAPIVFMRYSTNLKNMLIIVKKI
ncbi:MAG: class I SAM-dependent methyltransferase [Methanogenium sp.]|jgi:2-polyprenyl-3-methyl-5-hydroxy-6-metoxy-1,4-benzoquinol methylase